MLSLTIVIYDIRIRIQLKQANRASQFCTSQGIRRLEAITEADLGVCQDATISKDDFLLIGGRGSDAALEAHVRALKEQIEAPQGEVSDYDREKLRERVAKLSDGAAVIRVGGASEMEVGEKRDRINDALSATKAALERGIVPGGGVALLRCFAALSDVPAQMDQDQTIGKLFICRI